MKQPTLELVRYFTGAQPARTAIAVFFLFCGGISEVVGLAAMLPALDLVLSPAGLRDQSPLNRHVADLLHAMGLEPTLGPVVGLMVGAITVKTVFLWVGMLQVGYAVAHVAGELRLRLAHALLVARWPYFVNQQVGTLANAVSAEAHRAAWGGFREFSAAAASGVQILMYLIVALLVSWPVAILGIVVGASMAVALRGFSRMSHSSALEATASTDEFVALLTDVVIGLKPLKAMGEERRVRPVLDNTIGRLVGAQERQVRAIEGIQLFQEPVVAAALGAGLALAVRYEIGSPSALMLMAFLFYRLLRQFNNLQARMQSVADGRSALFSLLRKIRAAEDAVEPVHSALDTAPLGLRTAVELDNVSFSYGARTILRGASMRVPAGACATILGESGSGKTTLVDMVAGLVVPSKGRVLIDGRDLKDLSMRAWRGSIGYVPQEVTLLFGTLRDNVTLSDNELTDDDVWRALELAGAAEFVRGLGGGLDEPVGERGGRLSGGQRQRIALARALVRRPDLLILDEVTTALDPGTERQVISTLAGLVGQLTMISVSHRPHITEISDVVFEVSQGTVTQR